MTTQSAAPSPSTPSTPAGIQPGQVEYASYRNGFLKAQCHSRDSVLVSWPSGFCQGMKAETWDSGEFVEHPQSLRRLSGEQAQAAAAFLEGQGATQAPGAGSPTRGPKGP